MKHKLISLFLFLLARSAVFAQQEASGDSATLLDDVTVRSFEQHRSRRQTVTSITAIEFNNGDRNTKTSLVNGFNTQAGVRMEERSPGSYRINIRGSSLRSPFGVRNVKVYWNDIPMTDPGGNTYFNQFAWNNFSYLEIFKGPVSSMYGAGTGGLVQLFSMEPFQPGIKVEYVGGSYNLHNLFLTGMYGQKENRNQFSFAHNQSDGYRDHSALRRDNLSWISRFQVSSRQVLKVSFLYTDMYYQTPGALTYTEYRGHPKAARPASGGFPAAQNARAAIRQQNLTTGFTSRYQFSERFNNTTVLYGAFNRVLNPAIRNYERRLEPSAGIRTVFNHRGKKTDKGQFDLFAGAEFQAGWFNTRVSRNRNGNPDTVQTNDDIRYYTGSLFLQGDLQLDDKWFFQAGLGSNRSSVEFTRLSTYPVLAQKKTYRNEIAPRFAFRGNISRILSVKASVARGFSPPTMAELLPSNGVISTDLEAESGWNYETTLQANLLKNKLRLEATGFSFRLNKALVQRRDAGGADYFVNAGNSRQQGLELTADYSTGFPGKCFDYFVGNIAWTLNRFRYGSFIRGADDFSGNTIPSVPGAAFSLVSDLQLKNHIYSQWTLYTASAIWLNDANTAKAAPYHLLGWRIGWRKTIRNKYKLNGYAGADNILDETYSLGHDINAAAGRYYNAAPRRNYYAGISFQWIKPAKTAAPPAK